MLIGSLVIGFVMLCLHLSGVFARVILPELESSELAIPKLTMTVLSPIPAGIFIAGPLAAIMSTVDSMLIMISASLVKDVYLHYRHQGDITKISPKGLKRFSFFTTTIIGLLVFFAALHPPALLVWINLFAFGGLEAVFFLPLMLGLFWKKATAVGAFASMLAGLTSYIILVVFKINYAGINAIVPSLVIGLIAFLLANPLGRKADEQTLSYFGLDG
jgi:sodium/pantothenate symporter